MRKRLYYLMVSVLLVCLAMPASAQEGVFGQIDWVNGYITAFGQGTARQGISKSLALINSTKAARADAMRNLLAVVKGVYIDSHTMVKDFMIQEDVVNANVQGLLMGAQTIKKETEWMDETPLTTVTIGLCMNAQSPKCAHGVTLISSLPFDNLKSYLEIPKTEYSEDMPGISPDKIDFNYDSTKPVTGVVFRLKGHHFRRVLLPVVVAKLEGGDLATVYSVKHVDPGIVRSYGIVRYADTLDQATKIADLGDNFLVSPVEKVDEENTLIINTACASRISETSRYGNDYLRKAKVVISAE